MTAKTIDAPEGVERRVASLPPAEARADDEGPRISGHASVFNTVTEIMGLFREQVAPGAFKDAIGHDDVRALINHDPNLLLGRNTAGTLRLSEDSKGLAVEIDPPDTQIARDLIESLGRGDISQMSIGFRVRKEQWEEEESALPLRTILEAELFDVSVVTFPAFPTTDVGLRSLEGFRDEQRKALARPELAGAAKRRMNMELESRA